MLAHIEELAAARRGKSGNHHSRETRAAIGRKVSIALTGRTLSPEHCAALSAALKNRRFSEETRAKMSAGQQGRTHSAEIIEKIRERSRAWAAEHHEHMKKMTELRAAKSRGVPLSPEHRAKVSAAMKGKKKSLDHLAKISATLRGLNLPEDIKQIIREIAVEHHFNEDTEDE
jgi:NUMOD3 motif